VTVEDVAGFAPSDRPVAYRIVTPRDWWRIELDPQTWSASIDRLTRRQFAGLDDAPIERRSVAGELIARAVEAHAHGGIQMYLSTLVAGVLPLSSSLVISFTPGAGPAIAPTELVDEIAFTPHGQVVSCTVEELSCGAAVRRLARLEVTYPASESGAVRLGGPSPDLDRVPSLSVDWHVPVPGTGGAYLTLAFATPMIALEESMTDLFDTVARTFRWVVS
jgi:hypothetical protein